MTHTCTIKLSDVIIPESFRDTHPSEKKLNRVKRFVEKYGKLDKPIVLNGNILTDNYIRYLVAVEYGMEEVPFITIKEYREDKTEDQMPVTYIVGKFNGNDKEYIWKVTKKMDINVGDQVLVKSKFNGKDRAAVTVAKVFTSDDTDMLRHKPVIKKLKRTNKEQ